MPLPFDVEGPVRAEVFVVTLIEGAIALTGPDGPRAWHIETHGQGHPMEEAGETLRGVLEDLTLFHSTSWRWDHGSVVLTFLAVIPDRGTMDFVLTDRADLARSGTARAPTVIGTNQVLEHALRHLSWLAKEDEVVADALDEAWRRALASYLPAPFEQLQKGVSQ